MSHRAPPHAPRIGPMQRVLGRYYFTGAFWFRAHLWAARTLPEWVKRAAMPFAASTAYLCLGDVRRALVANQTIAQGPAGWWTRHRRAYRALRNFCWCSTERYEQFAPGRELRVEVADPDAWRALEGGGFIVVTSHIGNWELGSTVPSERGEPTVVHVVREAELDPESQALVADLLADLGGSTYVTHFATDDPNLGVELLDALRKDEVVALQADRPRAGGQVVRTTVRAHPFELPLGPVALARIADVPLLPAFTLRTGRSRYRLVFRPAIRVPRTSDREADHRAALVEVGTALEWALTEAPEQWFCFRDLSRVDHEAEHAPREGRAVRA